ncbi:MAG TPA: hypothetical protein VEC11_14215 [Allosphingosinicella sp.]|nr:hypothetical protein [Allosphingosinicella sp.]
MPPERPQDAKLEAEGVLVRPIGGQIYLVEEGAEAAPWDEEPAPDRGPLSGLINRH